jgi:DinB superfamily
MDKIQQDLFITTILSNWELAVKRASKIFDGYSDEELLLPIAPGKNRVVYLLGHLTAVHDRMLPVLGLGERKYPQLDELFVSNPDNPATTLPPIAELRSQWTTGNALLTEKLSAWTPGEWLERHTAVSAEDFAKEPHRNKLNIVLNRTGHLSYHLGQLALLKK